MAGRPTSSPPSTYTLNAVGGAPPSEPALYSSINGSSSRAEPGISWTGTVRTALLIYAACAAWLACSTSIIVINRQIIINLGFEYPIALSALGQLVSGMFASAVCWAWGDQMPQAAHAVSPKLYAARIMPVAVAQSVGLYLSNFLYLHLTVAFIEMARSALPLFILLATFLAGLETPTSQLVKAVSLTALGCGISAYGEIRLSVVGLVGLAANFASEGIRLVLTQSLLQASDFHPWQSLMLLSWPCGILLALMSAAFEYRDMVAKGAGAIVKANALTFVLAGVLGLAINFMGMHIIKLSGSTTLKVLAAARGPIVVTFGVLFLAETVTKLQFVGYAIALAGFLWYQLAKAQQIAHKSAARIAR